MGPTLFGALLLVCCLAESQAARAANDPARLRGGQQEWPKEVGCPPYYVEEFRSNQMHKFRPHTVICVPGNPGNCGPGSVWAQKEGNYCVECTCSNRGVADCHRMEKCPKKKRFGTHFHKRGKKECEPGCTFLSRESRYVNCDCDKHSGSSRNSGNRYHRG